MSNHRKHLTGEDALQALTSSGYLLESRVESLLRDNEFRVETNRLIPDDITGKMREVDVMAGWARCFTAGPDDETAVAIELVIECVHPPQPVAFLTKTRPDRFVDGKDFWDALKIVGNPQDKDVSPHNTWNWLAGALDLHEYHHYQAKRIATQYCSFQQKRGAAEWMALHRDEDHEAFRKLCLATDYYIRDQVVTNYSRSAGWNLTVVYPLLIVDAPIFDVRPTKRSAQIVNTQHVHYRCEESVLGEMQDYHIDVISEPYLQKYVSMLLREVGMIAERLGESYGEQREFWETRQRNLKAFHGANGSP